MRTPTSANALTAIDQHHWKDRNVPLGFDTLSILVQVIENRIVLGSEDCTSNVAQARKDVTRASSILSTLEFLVHDTHTHTHTHTHNLLSLFVATIIAPSHH
jgi:hypothetical protein